MQSPEPTPSIRSCAAQYAAMGWYVFPCQPKAKTPLGALVPKGLHDATIDPATIAAWWAKQPAANVGIRTGDTFWVLDVDVEKGGLEELESLEFKHGKLPGTLKAVTGTGGFHYFFKLPTDGSVISNSVAKIGKGLDCRSSGGYVVGPPSIHPNGTPYAWEEGIPIEEQEILDAPEWLLARVARRPEGKRAKAAPGPKKKVSEGGRNDTLTRMAGALRRQNASEEAIISALKALNWSQCDPPLPDEEVEIIARSVARYESATAPEEIPDGGDPSWHIQLQLTQGGIPQKNLHNAAFALSRAPQWAGRVAFNLLSSRIDITGKLPWDDAPARGAWGDMETRHAAIWLQQQGVQVSVQTAYEGISIAAERRKYHPVREYLNDVKWDGSPRLDTFAVDYLGATVEHAYVSTVLPALWMISAVARVFRPGVKADHMLILQGRQGTGKSSAFAVLGGEWYTDDVSDLHSKDAVLQLAMAWIVEMSELGAMKSFSELEHVKAFVSRNVDRIRPPYGHHVVEMPRQCVFSGTTNAQQYLTDDENRRFWTLRCSGNVDLEGLRAVRDQLWAEAKARFDSGAAWYISSAEGHAALHEAHADVLEEDVWEPRVRKWVENRIGDVQTDEVLTDCLKKDIGACTTSDRRRVGAILRLLGWESFQRRTDGARVLKWRKRT